MTLTPDQYDEMAQRFEEAAVDPLVRAEGREEFAKKAQWFHFLAQRGRESHRDNGHPTHQGNAVNLDPLPKQRGSLAPFLATLWISGAALYFVSTFMFANAINLTGQNDSQSPHKEGPPIETTSLAISAEHNTSGEKPTNQPASPTPRVDSNNSAEQHTNQIGSASSEIVDIESAEQDTSLLVPAPNGRHAIALNQPSYEAPEVEAPSSPSPASEFTPTSPRDPVTQRESDSAQSVEILRVTTTAAIRSAPSLRAKKIGSATAGVELQVLARENAWVHFIDPTSGNQGWVQSSFVAPVSGGEAKNVANSRVAETVPPTKPKLRKEKPALPAEVMQRQRAYAGLPTDEEFLAPRRRGSGLLSRRRLLREGLMTPGLLPPE